MAAHGTDGIPGGNGATVAPPAAATSAPPPPPPSSLLTRTAPPRQTRLGEELPVFCERCGYSLHGLPQVRCGSCRVLHFSCPECDHHQPINTLRPAFQRMLGRLRALGLILIVFAKLNFFGWTLFAWGVAGFEISYSYDYRAMAGGMSRSRLVEPALEEIGIVVLLCFGLAFAAVGRMLLLRWRSGAMVGLSLAVLVTAAWFVGAGFRAWEYRGPVDSPVNATVLTYVASAAGGILIGAAVVWGIWLALAHAFLPKRAAAALLEWQIALSARDPHAARTDETSSVTA